MARPIDFAPPFGALDAVGAPTDSRDERIDVGVAIVGAGPGGLACAIRLGQLLEEHPDVRERLGDVPIAVLEKGKQAGSHLLSGAVMNPSPLRELFRGRLKTADFPTYGEVPGEAVYVLTRRSAFRIPPPPTMRNHGNLILSVSELGRFLAEQAEALGAVVLPETAATKLLVEHGRVVGRADGRPRTRTRGRAASDFRARATTSSRGLTVLAEGTQGYLTGAAIDQFGLHGENPQIWALGVKEVWRVRKPLRKIVHTMGWPLRTSASFGEFGGSFIYPMGDDLVTVGFVAGLESTDVEFSVHDVLQEFKTHRLVWKILGGGERVAWGAKTITEGGYYSLPEPVQRAWPPARRRGRRARQRAAPEGRPLRDRVGPARGRGSVPRAAARRGAEPRRRARLLRRGAAREQAHGRSCARCATCARRSTRASSWAARSRAR